MPSPGEASSDLGLSPDSKLKQGCTFCRIASGLEDADVVCEGEHCLAFFPKTPATRGHTLVIPRLHVQNFLLVNDELGGRLMAMVVRVANALQTTLHVEGMNLISSAGSVAEQTVPHLHLHVVPRWQGDEMDSLWPPKKKTEEAVREDLATLVRAACSEPDDEGDD